MTTLREALRELVRAVDGSDDLDHMDGSEFTSAMAALDLALESARSALAAPDEKEWISVKDRLPDPETTVLYFHSMILVGEYNKWDRKWRFDPDEMVDDEEVTHWMPLPSEPLGLG